MKERSSFAQKIDKIIIMISIIFLLFVWSSYLNTNLINRLFFSIAIGIALYYIMAKLYKKLKAPNELKRIEKNKAIEVSQILLNADPIKTNKFFLYALQKKFESKQLQFNHIETKMENGDKAIFIINYKSELFTKNNLIQEYVDFINYSKIFIIAPYFDKECIICNKKMQKVILLDTFKTYNLLKFLNIFPKLKQSPTKLKFFQLFKNSITRQNAKSYFKISILLLLGSIFVSKNWFYRILSSLTLILTILCIVKKQDEAITTDLFFEQQ